MFNLYTWTGCFWEKCIGWIWLDDILVAGIRSGTFYLDVGFYISVAFFFCFVKLTLQHHGFVVNIVSASSQPYPINLISTCMCMCACISA